jgi:exonuclease III
MTDHGSFVLFNVYVPASGGQPLAYKMKFLTALRRAMQHERSKKPVVLVGDLNITLTRDDRFWKDRVVMINDVLKEDATIKNYPLWKVHVHKHWPTIEAVLKTAEVVPTTTMNSITKQKYQKYRMAVMCKGNRRVFLGSHESTPESCECAFDLKEWTYVDEETQTKVLAQPANMVRIQVLAELMLKIAGVEWTETTLREICEAADVGRESPPRNWLATMMKEDNMIDAFRYFYPEAQARFTCWHQFLNRRYVNDGSRIDFTLVDHSLLRHVQQGEGLRCGPSPSDESPLSEAAALAAATASGHFKPVAFEGGGIQEVSQMCLDTQFGAPHTGMVYTPPSFSDHIGVSLLMDDCVLSTDLVLDTSDARTRSAQPHKSQKSITSFFGSRDGTLKTARPIAASTCKPKAATRKPIAKHSKPKASPKNVGQTSTLLNHFRKK